MMGYRIAFREILRYLILLLLFVGVARADLSNGEVDVLTEDNFDKKTSRGTWLIEFYAPWCGHCKKLEPTFKAAARLLSGRVSLGKVDCTSQPALGTRFGVSGYPTIKAIGDIGVLDYRGARTVPAFVEYGELLSQPAIKAYAEQSNYKGEGKPVFLLLGGRAGEKKVYAKVAEARKMQSVFTYFTIPERPSPLGQEILAMLGITTQVDRESYRSGEERRLVIISESKVFDYRGIWDAEHMGSWVDRLKFGYMPQIANGLNNTYQYKDIKSPNSTIIIAAYSIVDEKEPSEIVKASMEEICENEFVRTSEMASPGKYYRCFWLHGPDMSKLLREEFGLDGIKNVPLIFAVNSDSDYFFHDDDPRSSAADAKDFVERLKNGDVNGHGFAIDRFTRMARNYVDFLGQAVLDRPVLVGGIMLICILVAWAIYSLPGFDEEEEFGELTEAESALRDAIMTGANDDTINKAKKAVYEERVKHGGRPVAAAPVADKAVKQPKKNTKLMDGKVSEPKAEQKPPNKSSNKGSKGKKEKKKSK